MKTVTILLGPPNVGKGTRLSQLNTNMFEILSVGDLLRSNLKNGTELGKQAKKYMDSGNLVPDDIICQIVFDSVLASEKQHFILDGFPRTANQAKKILIAEEHGVLTLKQAVVLEAEDSVLIKRSADRIVCGACGAVYTTNAYKPPKISGICDKCGSGLIKRSDDKPEVITNRLAVYREQTLPAIYELEKAGVKVVKINNISSTAAEEFKVLFK